MKEKETNNTSPTTYKPKQSNIDKLLTYLSKTRTKKK